MKPRIDPGQTLPALHAPIACPRSSRATPALDAPPSVPRSCMTPCAQTNAWFGSPGALVVLVPTTSPRSLILPATLDDPPSVPRSVTRPPLHSMACGPDGVGAVHATSPRWLMKTGVSDAPCRPTGPTSSIVPSVTRNP